MTQIIDISQMEAGPSLDRLIAERLGIKPAFVQFPTVKRWYLAGIHSDWQEARHSYSETEIWHDLPAISTCVSEAIRRLVPFGECSFHMNIRAVGGWYVTMGDNGSSLALPYGEGMVDDNQPALAICRAWWAWQDAIEQQT